MMGGIKYNEDSNDYNAKFYLSNNILAGLRSEVNKSYSNVKVLFNDKYAEEYFNIMPSEMFNFEHLQPKEDLKKLTLEIIDSNPDKIKEIYKLVKAITE